MTTETNKKEGQIDSSRLNRLNCCLKKTRTGPSRFEKSREQLAGYTNKVNAKHEQK